MMAVLWLAYVTFAMNWVAGSSLTPQITETFFGGPVDPIISQLVKQFDVEVSIVHGQISQTKGGSYGTLIVKVDGNFENTKAALAYLNTHEVQTEVLTDVN